MRDRAIIARAATYFDALWKLYTKARGKLLSKEQINERLVICLECEFFNGARCNLCGCCAGSTESHFNKLAFPTERCPADPPKWVEIDIIGTE